MGILEETVKEIKRKKELATLDDGVVKRKVQQILRREPKLKARLEAAKSFKEFKKGKAFDALKKEVREALRKVYGVFDTEKRGGVKQQALAKMAVAPDKENAEEVLALHQSSKERLPYYAEIYKRIFSITGEPRAILDLGCGYNPYSYDSLGCAPFYTAVDLPNEALAQITAFFAKKKVKGMTLGIDLVAEHEKLAQLDAVDVAFLFKLLDSLETVKRNISRTLLDEVKATWLVVSFPTVSIGGKKRIPKERRAWFEKLLKRKQWHHETFEIGGEIFYVVLKDPDEWARVYYNENANDLEKRYDVSVEPETELFAKYCPEGKVLDLGCGPGRDLKILSGKGYEMTGIDFSEQFITLAKKKAPNARIVKGDIRALPFKEGEFDGVWSMASIVHFYDDDLRQVLAECARVLKRRGTLFLLGKEGESETEERYGKKIYYRHDTKEELTRFVEEAGFTVKYVDVSPRRTPMRKQLNFISLIGKKSGKNIKSD